MSTKNLVPRNNNEGKIGTGSKKWNAVNATDLYGKLKIMEYDEVTATSGDDYIPIYDASNSEIGRVSISNLGTGGINTLDIRPENFAFDDTDDGVERGSFNGVFETLDFGNDSEGSIWYSFRFPDEWSAESDINLQIAYALDGDDPGKVVKFETRAWLVEIGDQPDSSTPDFSDSDNISTDSDNIGKFAEKELTNGEIISNFIPSGCKSIVIKFTRNVGDDTYSGTLQLIALRISQ